MQTNFCSLATMCFAAALSCAPTLDAALVIEPVFNRVPGRGGSANIFPIYDPIFLINGVAYSVADDPGEIVPYSSGDPRDPFLDEFFFWNNTRYDITGFILTLVGTSPVTDDPARIVRGPVDAVWGDVNGDGQIGLSDIFATIVVSADGKQIRFENGILPVGGRFTDIHLAVSDNPPFFAAIDSSFTGNAIPEPHTLLLTGVSLSLLFAKYRRRGGA